MAALGPYPKDGKTFVDKDPDDELYYVVDVTADLVNANTSAVSVELVSEGVVLLEGPDLQGDLNGLIVAKFTGTDGFCTYRVTCANTEQFDRTLFFAPVEN